MSQHKPVSFLVFGSSLFAASCVTVYAQPGRAHPPVLAPVAVPLAQAAGPEGETTEGPAQPEVGPAVEGAAEQTPPSADMAAPSAQPAAGHPGFFHGRTGGHMGDPEKVGPTDHQRVVGRWGIEARSVGTLQSSPNNPNPQCNVTPGCRDVRLTSVGVRRWLSEHYAYSVGLTLAMGGGSTSGAGSWDTHVGVGPTAGAFFLLSQWKHLAISATPQLGLLYFAPSGSGNKTFTANVMGKVEAELQLGFIGLPGLAIGTDAGLKFEYRNTGNDSNDAGGYSQWNLDTVGATSLWGLVTNAFVRFYL